MQSCECLYTWALRTAFGLEPIFAHERWQIRHRFWWATCYSVGGPTRLRVYVERGPIWRSTESSFAGANDVLAVLRRHIDEVADVELWRRGSSLDVA